MNRNASDKIEVIELFSDDDDEELLSLSMLLSPPKATSTNSKCPTKRSNENETLLDDDDDTALLELSQRISPVKKMPKIEPNKDRSFDEIILVKEMNVKKIPPIIRIEPDPEPVFGPEYSDEEIMQILHALENSPLKSATHNNQPRHHLPFSSKRPNVFDKTLIQTKLPPGAVLDNFTEEELLQISEAIDDAEKKSPNGSTTPVYIAGDISKEDEAAILKALQELDLPSASTNKQVVTLLDYEDYEQVEDDRHLNAKRVEKLATLNVIDPELEFLDPNPNIFELYRIFDSKFFNGFLTTTPLQLGWANNFFTCAGVFYSHKNGSPTILLSANLLTLRPRKDLVETLLHEMIHAFVYLKRIPERGDHGPAFHHHMHRINAVAKTNITVFHSFHDEVNHLRKYVWRCTGAVCRRTPPHNGFIQLPTKRKPSKFDFTFKQHLKNGCTGQFEKYSNNF